MFVGASLAVHPDKITIATGQVSGTSSDGKVSERDWCFIALVIAVAFRLEWRVIVFLLNCSWWHRVYVYFLPAAAGSSYPCVGLCQPKHTPCSGLGLLWPSLGLPGLLQVGKETPQELPTRQLLPCFELSFGSFLSMYEFQSCAVWQNGGNTLCAVDDSNDHILSVWDWQREDRLAEVKVC